MRYNVSDPDPKDFSKEFTITDTKTEEFIKIHFAWVGKRMNQTGTWDYCPLCEMPEIQPNEFEKFRLRLHQDDNFAKQQFIMNRRHDIWWDKHKTEKTIVKKPRRGTEGYTSFHIKYNNYSLTCYDVDGKKFIFSGSLEDKKIYEKHPEWLIQSRIWNILSKYYVTKRESRRLWNRFLWRMKINLTSEEIEVFRSTERAGKLLKDWLDEDEFRWLVHQGELSIKHDDETYVIRKDAYSTVKVVDTKKHVDEYCMVLKDYGGNDLDLLLSKILMIKTNPKKFKEIAIRRR